MALLPPRGSPGLRPGPVLREGRAYGPPSHEEEVMDYTSYRFAHHKLEAYRVASEVADLVEPLARRFGQGHRHLADQLRRAADSTVGLVGEGANRYSAKQKRQRFTEARGEAGEVACHMERAYRYRLVSEHELAAVLHRADRLCALLTGLIKRHS
jgi:four helix bundle protein